MSNVMDYIDWRGDLSFDAAPVNEIDKYIFTCIGKPDYTGIIPAGTETLSIKEALDGFLELHPENGEKLGVIASAKTIPAIKKASVSERYADVRLSGFINKISVEKTEQFSALTVLADGINYVSFRGTDDTIVGWKENCELAVYDCVPAQIDALKYLMWAAENYEGPLIVCGHSKGGNLATYAASYAPEEVQDRIIEVNCYDSPGFRDAFLAFEGYKRVQEKITTYVPYKSVIGMLLGQAGRLDVIDADTTGVVGHDGFTWSVSRDSFSHAPELSDFSKVFRSSIAETLEGMDIDDRKELVEEIFDVLTSSGAFTLSDFTEQNMRQALETAKQFRRAGEIRSFVFKVIEKSVKTSIGARREERRASAEEHEMAHAE